MRKQNWAASGASAGYIQEGGGRNSPGSVVRHSGWKKNLKSPKLEQTVVRENSSTEHDFKGWFSALYFTMLCGSLDGRWFGVEWIHVYVWPNPFIVHLKLSHHC